MKPIEVVNRWYYSKDIHEITGISNRQLRYWDENNFFVPTEKTKRRRKYSFLDLIQLGVVSALLKNGLSLQGIRKSIKKLGEILPNVTFPLLELEIDTDGKSIFVHHRGAWFEAHTGQYMICFQVESLYNKVVNIFRKKEEIIRKSKKFINTTEEDRRKKGLFKMANEEKVTAQF